MKIFEIFGYSLMFLFVIGWIDVGQGKDLTWWNFIAYYGEMLK